MPITQLNPGMSRKRNIDALRYTTDVAVREYFAALDAIGDRSSPYARMRGILLRLGLSNPDEVWDITCGVRKTG